MQLVVRSKEEKNALLLLISAFIFGITLAVFHDRPFCMPDINIIATSPCYPVDHGYIMLGISLAIISLGVANTIIKTKQPENNFPS